MESNEMAAINTACNTPLSADAPDVGWNSMPVTWDMRLVYVKTFCPVSRSQYFGDLDS